jgi:thiazole tautomerase (transcriptional regulator TenI)
MRPLPRLHAITDASVLALDDLGVRAAAIASAGPAVALHARDRSAGGARLVSVARRFLTLARPPEAAVFVNGRPDIGGAIGAQGVQLGAHDLTPTEARASFPLGWIGRSVHSVAEAERAVAEGADFLLVGTIFPSPTHPGQPGAGPGLVRDTARLGPPVIAIGGIDAERAVRMHQAGAYGVAAIGALWRAADSAAAALALLAPWLEDA